MKILHLLIEREKASGVTTFVENVAREQQALGHIVNIVTKSNDTERSTHRVMFSTYDVIHIHGLWDPWLHGWAKRARKANVKIVWSPHGMLTKWAFRFKWWKKLPAWYLYQKRDLKSATVLHVTADSEVEDVRRVGLRNKVVIAPLGVDLPPAELVKPRMGGGGGYVMLFVSRIQRKKGLVNLLKAWAKLK